MNKFQFGHTPKQIRAIVAYGDDKARYSIANCLSKTVEIIVSDTTSNGIETLSSIFKLRPDVLIIDMLIPEKGGLWVLDELRKFKYSETKIIAVNTVKSDCMENVAISMGADFCVNNAFDTENLRKTVLSLCSRNEEKIKCGAKYSCEISDILNSLGVSPALKGYYYIKSAVLMVLENPQLISGVTKILYPEIAKQYDTQSKCVERDIRHAIFVSWNLSKNRYSVVLGYDFSKRPTNKELINTLAECIKNARQASDLYLNGRNDMWLGGITNFNLSQSAFSGFAAGN